MNHGFRIGTLSGQTVQETAHLAVALRKFVILTKNVTVSIAENKLFEQFVKMGQMACWLSVF